VGFYPGLRVAAHVVTPGVALLATMDDLKLQRWIGEHVFTPFTSKTVTDPAVFLQRVHATRELGYWIIEEHLDPALLGVAMALAAEQRTHPRQVRGDLPRNALHAEERKIFRHLLDQHLEAGIGADAPGLAGAQQRRRLVLHQDVDHAGICVQSCDVERQRIYGVEPERRGIDDQVVAGGIGRRD
ncbi:MAG: hypothetical protein EOP82_27455, partial [Variovorax sp.]